MKNYIILLKADNYNWPLEYTNKDIYSLMRLITNYGANADWLISLWNINKRGITGGSMEVLFENNLAHIEPLFCDNAEEYRVTLPKDTLKFIIDRWQELIALKPDAITISEENSQYSICAEFKASIEASNQ